MGVGDPHPQQGCTDLTPGPRGPESRTLWALATALGLWLEHSSTNELLPSGGPGRWREAWSSLAGGPDKAARPRVSRTLERWLGDDRP